jgi:hypothetical protein
MKKFVSLGAALMMGTVLSKKNHNNHEEASIVNANTVRKQPVFTNVVKFEDSPNTSLDE